jgi:uncharacterized membrane protein
MYHYRILASIAATVFLAGCGATSQLDKVQTTDISALAHASGLCNAERTIEIDDVSYDGSVVVGKCAKKTAPNERQGFRYSKTVGFEIVKGPAGESVDEIRVSGDGRVIWGSYFVKNEGSCVFRIGQSAEIRDFGTMGKPAIRIGGVSADGSAIVGSFLNSTKEYPTLYRPYRYSESGGFEDIGLLGGDSTIPYGVSASGSQVVGHVDTGTNSTKSVRNISTQAFLYSSASGMRNLGSFRDGHVGIATGATDDGAVVVGIGRFIIGFVVSFYEDGYGFVRTANGEARKLGGIHGVPTVIRISADGTTVAGATRDSNGKRYVFTAVLAREK